MIRRPFSFKYCARIPFCGKTLCKYRYLTVISVKKMPGGDVLNNFSLACLFYLR